MLVVSDTSPLNYLILIDAISVLPDMYGRIIVPPAVSQELSAVGAPAKTTEWWAQRPAWVEVVAVSPTIANPPRLHELDPGEAEAILLAKTLSADLLLIDERRGTLIARNQEHLPTTGTLGVLLDAAIQGRLDLQTSIHRLRSETIFQAAPSLYEAMLKEFQKRMSGNV